MVVVVVVVVVTLLAVLFPPAFEAPTRDSPVSNDFLGNLALAGGSFWLFGRAPLAVLVDGSVREELIGKDPLVAPGLPFGMAVELLPEAAAVWLDPGGKNNNVN